MVEDKKSLNYWKSQRKCSNDICALVFIRPVFEASYNSLELLHENFI